ncbi:hypothetical protein SLEP1_g21174 [Rubroshorea leprosula]|uniref:non-specific serine/threonine protein kinase n=1 Tax=Rubroshorea leprosula TaxID=152421 RepID=A0AAV5J8A7_9ROSI|nr:hypothetical protein SLEP1_g21174 [Rubroshorea leprosula]
MHPLHLPGSFFFIIITFVLIHAHKFASSVDERYEKCNRTFACGKIKNIGYPFWGSDRPDYCGFPGFQLNCRDSFAEITIMSVRYHVLGIKNEFRLLNVARPDYRGDLCSIFLFNTTLDPDGLFKFTPDTQEINLYYHCALPPLPPLTSLPSTPPTPPTPPTPIQCQGEMDEYLRHFTCNVNGVTFCGYYLTRNLSGLPDYIAKISGFLGSCGKRVVLAANQSEIQSMEERPSPSPSPSPKGENLAKALAKGFGLQWNASNSLCDRCRGSGGQCGYNTVSNKFSCYCTDRPYDTVCPTPTGQFVTT